MKDFERLIELAKIVRRAFEKFYHDEKLSTCCYRASLELFLLAKVEGIDVKIAGNWGHVFCLFGDAVIDLTAAQFGHKDKIAIGRVGEWLIFWNVNWSGRTLDEAKLNCGWVLDCHHDHDVKYVMAEYNNEQRRLANG